MGRKKSAGRRLTIRLPVMSETEPVSGARVREMLGRYVALQQASSEIEVLTDEEWDIADVALADWQTEPAHYIFVTAASTARASGEATREFLRKLRSLGPFELCLLAEQLEARRRNRRKKKTGQ